MVFISAPDSGDIRLSMTRCITARSCITVTAGMFVLFGDSDLIGRILPCVFGTALIPLLYYLYRM